MERLLRLLLVLGSLSLTPALAQSGSFFSIRAAGGLNTLGLAALYGTVGAEVEWLEPFAVVYPRGSVAYMLGGSLWLGTSTTGGSLHFGTAVYTGPGREGLFAALRVGGALLSSTSLGLLSLTGGYRLINGPVELGLEGGLLLAGTETANQSLLYINPTLTISAGWRF